MVTRDKGQAHARSEHQGVGDSSYIPKSMGAERRKQVLAEMLAAYGFSA